MGCVDQMIFLAILLEENVWQRVVNLPGPNAVRLVRQSIQTWTNCIQIFEQLWE